jgi:hypothetical protein
MTFDLLVNMLRELISLPPAEIQRSEKLESLIPPKERRRVWSDLRQAGFGLPSLQLAFPTFMSAVILVAVPSILVAIQFGIWSVFLSLPILSILAYWRTRPFAIHPPDGCQTVYQAACYITQFTPEDYKAGLWSHEQVATRVRNVLAEAACASPDEIRGDMTMEELFAP